MNPVCDVVCVAFCHYYFVLSFVSGRLRFASVVVSFIYIFILTTSFCVFFACPISLKRFIGRHRSVAGSHYSLFRAKYEIREHGERHFPSIIPSPRHSNGALLRQRNAWRVRPSLRNIISLVPFPKLRIVNMMAWWPSIKCGSQFMWGGETLLPLCVIFIF